MLCGGAVEALHLLSAQAKKRAAGEWGGGWCGGVVWGGNVLSALCGIRVLSDRVVMALRRGEGMVHPLTAPGAK